MGTGQPKNCEYRWVLGTSLKKIFCTDGYRLPARKKFGTDAYRVPARKNFFGSDGYRPGKKIWVPMGTGKIITYADP